MAKTTWIGLDVHASTIAIGRWSCGEKQPEVTQIPNEPKVIRRVFRKLARDGELRVCYEAGPCGYELYRQLQELGIDCKVVAPSLIPRRPGDRVKTDRRDAAKLAKLFRSGELTFVRVPERSQEGVRNLLRARDDARRDRMAARHRLSKFLLRFGLRFTAGTNWTLRFWRWVEAQEIPLETDRFVFERYIDQVRYLDGRIEEFDREIERIAHTDDFRDAVGVLTCLRGIHVLSAMIILSELYDLRRFESPRQLMAFIGLVPSERSSGSSVRRGGITKTGNNHVRRILVEAAWVYGRSASITSVQRRQLIEQPPRVGEIVRSANRRLTGRFRRLVGRGKKSPAVAVAVARELCGFVWALGNYSRCA